MPGRVAGIPEDIAFATKPALATEMITRALDAGAPAGWVAGDEVYGQDPELRAELARRGLGYVLAIRKSHLVLTPAGLFPAAELARRLPARAWQRLSAGPGAKGPRWYDWALIEAADPAVTAGQGPHWLLIRRRIGDGELAFYRVHAPHPVPLAQLVKVAGSRSQSSMSATDRAVHFRDYPGSGLLHVAGHDSARCSRACAGPVGFPQIERPGVAGRLQDFHQRDSGARQNAETQPFIQAGKRSALSAPVRCVVAGLFADFGLDYAVVDINGKQRTCSPAKEIRSLHLRLRSRPYLFSKIKREIAEVTALAKRQHITCGPGRSPRPSDGPARRGRR